MKIEQLCVTLKEYLSQFPVLRILMPLSVAILYVCGALEVLNIFISLGSVVLTLAFLIGIVMMIMVLAQCQFFALAVGIGLYALADAISFLRVLIMYHYIPYGTLIYLLVYAGLAFLSYRKSLSLR